MAGSPGSVHTLLMTDFCKQCWEILEPPGPVHRPVDLQMRTRRPRKAAWGLAFQPPSKEDSVAMVRKETLPREHSRKAVTKAAD